MSIVVQRISIILANCILTCCSQTTVAQIVPSSPDASAESTWQLLVFTESGRTRMRRPFIHFSFQGRRITGNNGCNNFAGTFNFTQSEHALSFNNDFKVTKMSCSGINERAFFSNLFRTNRYYLKGDTLLLQSQNTPLSYWKRVK